MEIKKCPFCREDLEDWIDITQEIEYEPRVTTTDEKWGYIQISLNKFAIGSIGMDGVKIYKQEFVMLRGKIQIRQPALEIFKIASHEFGGRPSYFKIYIKKHIWEKLKEIMKKEKT